MISFVKSIYKNGPNFEPYGTELHTSNNLKTRDLIQTLKDLSIMNS